MALSSLTRLSHIVAQPFQGFTVTPCAVVVAGNKCLLGAVKASLDDGAQRVEEHGGAKAPAFGFIFRINAYIETLKPLQESCMRSSTAVPARQDFDPALRGVCEKSARSVLSVLRRAAPVGASPEILLDFAASLTGVIERSAELLLAGKQVRVIEDDEALTTQEAADLLNVSRPHLVKLLDRGEIPPLPKVGRHRRVARASVLKYKRIRDAQREYALKELAALSQHHGLGY